MSENAAPDLIQQAQNLRDRLSDLLFISSGRRRLKIKRILNKARRRLNRRLAAAGKFIPIRGLESLINSLEADWF